MREFVQKRNQTQKAGSIDHGRTSKLTTKASLDSRPILPLQRTTGNRATILQSPAQDYGFGRDTAARPSGDDFSRIPTHFQTQKESTNIAADKYKQDAHDPSQTERVQEEGAAEVKLPSIVHEVLQSAGQPLDSATRGFMEARLGHDFSRVRVHADERAAESSRALGALAYTAGHNVVFGSGRYEPAGPDGRRLLAHELTHVVQQQRGVHLANVVSEAGDPYEQHADRVADLVAQGRSAKSLIQDTPLGGDNTLQRNTWPADAAFVQMQHDEGETAPPAESAPATEAASPEPAAPEPAASEPAAPETPAPADKKPAKLHLFTDVDVKHLGFSDLMEGDVGHTWISIEYKDPAAVPGSTMLDHYPYLRAGGKYSDPMGFWPATNEGIYYSANPFDSWVKGWMRHPDRAHEGAEDATETWDIDETAVNKVIEYAEKKVGAQYSVFYYNCTTFAKEAIEAAGQNAPRMSTFGFCLPNAVYDGIKARQRKGIGQTSVKDFETKKETTVSGPDEPPKKR
jgi:hypothetical protein